MWLADIQKGLGIQTSDLVGYSLGAYATGLMKLAQPDRVGRLVHAGPAAVYGPFNRWFFARVLVATSACIPLQESRWTCRGSGSL